MTYAQFADAFHAHFTRDPNDRAAMGLLDGLGDLPDPSAEAERAQLDEARDLLRQLVGIPRDGLDFDQRLDVDLARLSLEREVHDLTRTFNGRTRSQQLPRAGDDVGDGIFMLLINDPRPDADRLEDTLSRLRQVPSYCGAMLARLDTPVARWVAIDRTKVAGLPEFLRSLLGWADAVSWSRRDELATAIETAIDALASYGEALGELPTTDNLHLSDADARTIVKLRGNPYSLEELHRIASDFLASTRAELHRLRDVLVARYDLGSDTTIEQMHHWLNERFAVRVDAVEQVLDVYQAERDKVRAFCDANRLFPIPDDEDMLILKTPAFMEPSIPAGAMMPPPPFREGTARSLVYLTLSEDLMDEHTQLAIPNMMIHEGIPGHHLQLASAAAHPSIIRRHYDGMDLAEGWTTMLEDYMLDLGYLGDLTDEARFIGKFDIARIGARVAIDLYFMTGDASYLDVGVPCDLSAADAFGKAGALLKAVTGFTDGRVQAELNWYSQERGYPLSYLSGNHMVWQIKRDLAATWDGEPLDLDRRFHAVFLGAGNMPVAMLRRVFVKEGMLEG